MKTIRFAIVAVLLSCLSFQASAIQNCWFETPKYVYTSLKISSTGPYVDYLTQWGYVCYGSYGGIQPAALFALGNGHSSMTAWLNWRLNVPSGSTIFNAGAYSTTMDGYTSCQNRTASAAPIQYWNITTSSTDYYPTTEWYTQMSGSYCSEDVNIYGYDDLRKPNRTNPATQSACRERALERDPSTPSELSTTDLLMLAEHHQTYLRNRATREQREIFMDRMREAMSGYFDTRSRAVAMEASLRAAVSELEERAIPLGDHVRRAPRLTQPVTP